MTMTTAEVRELQHALNGFTKRYRLGFAPLLVDGKMGVATRRRVRFAKHLLGYRRKNVNGAAGPDLLWRVRHPRTVDAAHHQTAAAVKAGKKRRRKRRRNVAANYWAAVRKPGVTIFDGIPVARPFVPYLRWAREHGWRGRLQSGFRTPAYSESLCYAMCGAPTCPGRCAGRGSRHSQTTIDAGAVDVSDYGTFGEKMAEVPHQPHLRNTLGARDPVHFSKAGN